MTTYFDNTHSAGLTNYYNLSLLHQNQAMKEITINEAFVKISALLNKAILKTVSTISVSLQQEGSLVLVSENPIVEINKYKNYLALYIFNEWNYIKPQSGMIFYNLELQKWLVYEKDAWKNC